MSLNSPLLPPPLLAAPPSVPSAETAAYDMEQRRRPVAARRLHDEPMSDSKPVADLDASVYQKMEASRRPRAAQRLGLFQSELPALVQVVAPMAKSVMDTAAGAMEASRRPKAKTKTFGIQYDKLQWNNVQSVANADTAYAQMEQTRRPHAAARAEKLRRVNAPRSILHPEQVGSFALDTDTIQEYEAERAFAKWRAGGVEREDVSASTFDEFEQLKQSLSQQQLAPEVDPFSALERMLETHLQSPMSPDSRGGSTRGANSFSGTTSRGGSTRGASAFLHTRRGGSRHGSSANLERDAIAGNVVARRVHCSVEKNDDVVCRLDDEVVERVNRNGVDAKVRALADQLQRERLTAPDTRSR